MIVTENEGVEQIKRFLTLITKLRPAGQAQLLLEYGRGFNVTPDTLSGIRGPVKQCYQNAWRLAMDNRELTYTEGYVNVGIPIEHAWCVDKAGNVIDPTLRKEGRVEGMEPVGYFGIPFKTEYIMKVARETGYYGVISYTNMPLLEGAIPPEEFLA